MGLTKSRGLHVYCLIEHGLVPGNQQCEELLVIHYYQENENARQQVLAPMHLTPSMPLAQGHVCQHSGECLGRS